MSGMSNITVYIPYLYEDVILKLIKKKRFPSRSEAIRTAIVRFLDEEIKNLERLVSLEAGG